MAWAEDLALAAMRIVIGSLFLYSGIPKLFDPIGFLLKVSEYEVLAPEWEESFAVLLPWAMVICGAFLLLGLFTRAMAGVSSSIFLSFIIAIYINIWRAREMSCGCFSEDGGAVGWPLLGQDLLWFVLALLLMARGGGAISLDRLAFVKIFNKWQEFADDNC